LRIAHASPLALAAWAFALLAPSRAFAQDLEPPPTGTPPPPPPPSTVGQTPPPVDDNEPTGEKKKDSGRGLEWFYLNADAGLGYVNMTSFSSSNFALQTTSSTGPSFGAAAGLRLFIVTIGARANFNDLADFQFWQLDGEIGLHIPIGHFEPYFGIHGGYCFVGSLTAGVSNSPSVTVTGGDAGLQVGLDYYFNHFVSLGLDVSGNALFMSRPATTLPADVVSQLPAQDQTAYKQSGDSVGFGLTPSLRLGFHL
jgi:hypothetical protein